MGEDEPSPRLRSRDAVAIVTGGWTDVGRTIATVLALWGWAIVVVYLDQQGATEAAVAEILAAGGRVVAVRADLADDLDVQRLFVESRAAFATVDVLVHTTPDSGSLLYEHAARRVAQGGAIASVTAVGSVASAMALMLRERGISVVRGPPEEILPFLDDWRRAESD